MTDAERSAETRRLSESEPGAEPRTPAHGGGSWERAYRAGDPPWDTGRPSEELIRALAEHGVRPGSAVELGCGTGTNCVWLAQAGFKVTGLDVAPTAVAAARARATDAGVEARFVVADLLDPPPDLGGPFDFVFDRGCYHVLRQIDLERLLATVEGLVHPGTEGLFLTGNSREPTPGPPTVSEEELRSELGRIFEIVSLREFRFDLRPDAGMGRPLGWSCFVRRP